MTLIDKCVYAVVRRPYGYYADDGEDKLMRVFESIRAAREYIESKIIILRPIEVYDSDESIRYAYGYPDSEDPCAKVELPVYVIKPFYLEG